ICLSHLWRDWRSVLSIWGAPRIHGELLKLGIDIGESSVSRYICCKPPSQTWRTFLENHAQQLVSLCFFTVPTVDRTPNRGVDGTTFGNGFLAMQQAILTKPSKCICRALRSTGA